MLPWMFICILFLAILLFFVIFIYEDVIQTHWCFGLIIFDIALWFALAGGVFEIEYPYQIFNASSGEIETHYQIFSSKTSPALMYIFSAPAIFMIFYMTYRLFYIILTWYKKTF
jgi:hypothetical protein